MQFKSAVFLAALTATSAATAQITCNGNRVTAVLNDLASLSAATAAVTRNFDGSDKDSLLQQYQKPPTFYLDCSIEPLSEDDQTIVCQSYSGFAAAEGDAVQSAIDKWDILAQAGVGDQIKSFFLQNYRVTVEDMTLKIADAVPSCVNIVTSGKQDMDKKFDLLSDKP